jgi:redox-sensing transcriptional repressor
MTRKRISDSAVRRLSRYLRFLRDLERVGKDIVSSRELAEGTGTTAAQVRKDLSHFGSFGKRGQGYVASELRRSLREILGLGRRWHVAVIGVGKIGSALLGYGDLTQRGFDIVAAFDSDPVKVDEKLGGVRVRSLASLEADLASARVDIAIIATPPDSAQSVASRAAAAGVPAILNFAPVKLEVAPHVVVRSMDVSLELEGLSFLLSSSGGNGSGEKA